MLLMRSSSIPADSLERRRLVHQSPVNAMNTYKAPLLLADEATRIENEYFVFLHHGYSMEEHKQAIGNSTNLELAITHIFPESGMHGLFYNAHLDDASLAAVRADIGVDVVEYDTQGFFIGDVAPPLPYDYYKAEVDELEALLFP